MSEQVLVCILASHTLCKKRKDLVHSVTKGFLTEELNYCKAQLGNNTVLQLLLHDNRCNRGLVGTSNNLLCRQLDGYSMVKSFFPLQRVWLTRPRT